MCNRWSLLVTGSFLAATCVAKEDLEFVQEHLPEVAMDNRYASLPLWHGLDDAAGRVGIDFQSAFASTSAGALRIDGPMFSIGLRAPVGERWEVGALGFYDPLRLHASNESRDLQTQFAPTTPIARPVAAAFSNLDGSSTDLGGGLYAARFLRGGVLGEHRWLGGILWQRVALEDYRFDYRILTGSQTGTSGMIDFDAVYTHLVPFAGLELPRTYERWETNAHVLMAFPWPRRGIIGHITGPGFDIRGDTADVGYGKHFGDPSVTVGYALTYRPAHVSVDLGTLLTQALFEPWVHRGIDRNILLSFTVGLSD